MKEKSGNYKAFLIRELRTLMNRLEEFRTTIKKAIKMTNKSSSSEIKFKKKEEKVKLIKVPSKS